MDILNEGADEPLASSAERLEPDAGDEKKRVSESRRSGFEDRSCEGCGQPLTGRKERFCSDRCRMRIYRKEQQARIGDLLTSIEHFTAELRKELEAPSGL